MLFIRVKPEYRQVDETVIPVNPAPSHHGMQRFPPKGGGADDDFAPKEHIANLVKQ